MNRVQLMELKERCNGDLNLIKQELERYFHSEEGKEVLKKAPNCLLYTSHGENIRGHETTKELAIKGLLKELG